MSAPAKQDPTLDAARQDAAEAWRAAGASSARHVMATRDGDVFTLERVAYDAAPGENTCEDERGHKVTTRARLTLDGDLELVVDNTRSRRIDTAGDFQWGDTATGQFREIAPKLRALGTLTAITAASLSNLRLAGDGQAANDAQVTAKLIKKYGTDDLRRLRSLVCMLPEATRTVSRLAAADDMTDLFIGAELVVQAPDFNRVEQRRPYFREMFPMRSLNAPGAVAYEAHYFDRRGRAEHTANFRGRAPTVTVMREAKLRPLVWMRAGMVWSWLELQQWAQARSNGAPLPDFVAEQRDAAREALLELENLDLTFGNPNLNLIGLLTPDNGIPTPAAVANYADAASGEEAVQLLLKGAKEIVLTESEAVPEVIALGTRDYLYVTTTTYDPSNSNGESIAEVALRRGKDLGVRAIVRMPELGFSQEVKNHLADLGYEDPLLSQYAGGMIDGTNKAVQLTFSRNPRKARGVIGQDLMQLPPDRTSSETHVQVLMSTGGFEVLHPRALHRQIVNDPT